MGVAEWDTTEQLTHTHTHTHTQHSVQIINQIKSENMYNIVDNE